HKTIYRPAGANIIKGSLFTTVADLRFYTLADAVVSATGTVMVKAQCNTAGIAGITDANTIANIPYSIPGITAVNNLEASYNAFNQETDAQLLARYLLKVRTPATSGNIYHYQQWALSVDGVGQCKVIPLWNGNGTVKVIIIDSNNQTASADLIKSVSDYIESVYPIGATLTVTSPAPFAINIVANSVKGNYDMQTITNNINAYFNSNGFSLSSISIAQICKILLSSGITDYDYDTLLVNGTNKDIPISNDQLPVCGMVTLNA
ncbi:baseplate J/gp47 family protein, partial [Pectinatus frisingensis]|uniref:baseplate J/gp47 family protein n=1 Tax=Pectinatus frisingensis TaxID=865 RepID=UPI0018C7AA15